MNSEIACFWRAISILCPEETRLSFKAQRENDEIDDYTIALKLRIPELYVRRLFDDRYLELIEEVKG